MKTHPSHLMWLAAVLLCCTLSGPVRAGDSTSFTLLPRNGASLVVSRDGTALAVAYSSLSSSGLRIGADASAPFGSQSPPLTSLGQLASGATLGVHIGHDPTGFVLGEETRTAFNALCDRLYREWKAEKSRCGALKPEEALAQGCHPQTQFAGCTLDTVEAWIDAHPQEAEALEYRRARRSDQNLRHLGIPSAANLQRYRSNHKLPFVAAGLDLNASIDQISAYRDDVAAAPQDFLKTVLRLGGHLDLYPGENMGLTLHGGFELLDSVPYRTAQRCEALPSSDPDVTGQACQTIKFLTGEPSTSHQQDYGLTFTALKRMPVLDKLMGTSSPLTPGLEYQLNVRGIGSSPALETSLAGFLISQLTKGDTGRLRAGVGVRLTISLEDATDGSAPAGSLTGLTPFAVLATSL